MFFFFFFFNDTATTEIYTLSLHDALPIWKASRSVLREICRLSLSEASDSFCPGSQAPSMSLLRSCSVTRSVRLRRSEEHTSELQSQSNLVCRLLLEKKKKK